MNNNILQVKSVSKDYRTGDFIVSVLKGVSLEIYEAEILAIVGPSGAGKSSLLHIMGFLDKPTKGEVHYKGTELSKLNDLEQACIRNKEFGFVFQMYHLLPELNSMENAMLPLMIRYNSGYYASNQRILKEKTLYFLDKVGLGKRLHHRPHELSGGEKQRLAIARALIGEPRVVFCDEPTGNLDASTSKEIQDLIVDLNHNLRQTFVIVTHDPSIAALAQRQIKMSDGFLVQ